MGKTRKGPEICSADLCALSSHTKAKRKEKVSLERARSSIYFLHSRVLENTFTSHARASWNGQTTQPITYQGASNYVCAHFKPPEAGSVDSGRVNTQLKTFFKKLIFQVSGSLKAK